MFFWNKLTDSYTSIIEVTHFIRTISLSHLCGSWTSSIPYRWTIFVALLRFVVSHIYLLKSLPFFRCAFVATSTVGSIIDWMEIYLIKTRSWLLLDQKVSLNFVLVWVRFDLLVLIASFASCKKTHRLRFDIWRIGNDLEYYLRHIMGGQGCTCPNHHY